MQLFLAVGILVNRPLAQGVVTDRGPPSPCSDIRCHVFSEAMLPESPSQPAPERGRDSKQDFSRDRGDSDDC